MADEPDNLVLRMLRDIREQMVTKADLKSELAAFATKDDLAQTERRIRADVASDLLLMRKELSEQIVGLRRAVVDYHSTRSATASSSASWRRACGASRPISTCRRSPRTEP